MTAALVAPTVVTRIDAAPTPRAEVTIHPVADTFTYTITRTDTSGTTVVRGAYRARAAGSVALIVDYELPFGQPVTYAVTAYDMNGVASAVSPSSAPVTLPDPSCPWLADALAPTSAMQVTPTEWVTRDHERVASILWPVTADAAAVVANVRPRPTSDMQVLTSTDAEAAALRVILAATTAILRPPSTWQWPGGYVYLDAVTETRTAPKRPTDPHRLWDMTLVPVLAPPPVLVVPVVTWARVESLYATWAALVAAKATWLDVVRNPDPGSP